MTDFEALTARVEALEKRGQELDWMERELLKHARQYARLSTLGYGLCDDGTRIKYSQTDARELAKYHADKVLALAVDLLRAETS